MKKQTNIKKNVLSFIKNEKYLVIATMLFVFMFALCIFTSITFARYVTSNIKEYKSDVANYELQVIPRKTGDLIVNYIKGTDIIVCDYVFSVQNYNEDIISEISFVYSIFFIVPNTINGYIQSAKLMILDENFEETTESYALSNTNSYVDNNITYYSYSSEYSATFLADQAQIKRYSLKFEVSKTDISNISEDGSSARLEGFQIKAYANQII